MGLQLVSVQKCVWPSLSHALCMVWDLADNVCLHHGLVFVAAQMHHMCLTSCVASGCLIWTNDLSSMGLQLVSVQKYVWPMWTHAWCMVWDLQCLLAPRLHVCCRATPHVADKSRCLWVFFCGPMVSPMDLQVVSAQKYL